MVNYAQIIEDLEKERDITLHQLDIFQKLAAIDGQIQLLKQLIELEQKEIQERQKSENKDGQPTEKPAV